MYWPAHIRNSYSGGGGGGGIRKREIDSLSLVYFGLLLFTMSSSGIIPSLIDPKRICMLGCIAVIHGRLHPKWLPDKFRFLFPFLYRVAAVLFPRHFHAIPPTSHPVWRCIIIIIYSDASRAPLVAGSALHRRFTHSPSKWGMHHSRRDCLLCCVRK